MHSLGVRVSFWRYGPLMWHTVCHLEAQEIKAERRVKKESKSKTSSPLNAGEHLSWTPLAKNVCCCCPGSKQWGTFYCRQATEVTRKPLPVLEWVKGAQQQQLSLPQRTCELGLPSDGSWALDFRWMRGNTHKKSQSKFSIVCFDYDVEIFTFR